MSNINGNLESDYESLIENSEPIDVDDPRYEKIFKDLQGGIIKSYGRNYYLYIFLSFYSHKIEQIKQWIRDKIASSVTSTYVQVQHTKDYKRNKQELEARDLNSSLEEIYPGELCKNFFLSYQGYKILGFKREIESPFSDGMEVWWERHYKSQDNDSSEYWDIGGKDKIHALILLAHDSLNALRNEATLLMQEFGQLDLGKIVATEIGYKLVNEQGQFIGPFGFVDSFSQPIFCKSDYDTYCSQQNIDKWDPKASLSLVLVKDPLGESFSFGSYCVWQKLETNHKKFEELENELAAQLECSSERVAALVVGRFRDGTPLALYDNPNQDTNKNNFDYYEDHTGTQCPIQAHIRKVNPRRDQSIDDDIDPNIEERKKHRIVRSGITYFDDPKAKQLQSNLNKLEMSLKKLEYLQEVQQISVTENIENISGLLFVCFQSSIVNQFQKLQLDWADNKTFPRQTSRNEPIYLDPVIGHPITKSNQREPQPQKWPIKWNENNTCPFAFYGCVKNKGGEFFFVPSMSFLSKLSK